MKTTATALERRRLGTTGMEIATVQPVGRTSA